MNPPIPLYNIKPSMAFPCEHDEKTSYEWEAKSGKEKFTGREQLSATLC
jgi:hypothetical protein